MDKFLQAKNRQELEAELQELGRGIGPVRINEKGEIFVFDEKETKKEYKMGQIRMPNSQEVQETQERERESKNLKDKK